MAPSQRLLPMQCNRKDPNQHSISTTAMDGPVDRVSTKQEKKLHGNHGTVAFCRVWRGLGSMRRAKQTSADSSICKKLCPAFSLHASMQVCIAFAIVIDTCLLPNRQLLGRDGFHASLVRYSDPEFYGFLFVYSISPGCGSQHFEGISQRSSCLVPTT